MKKSIFYGLLASLLLIAFYFAAMLLFTRSLSAAISQAEDLLPWFTLLVIGFGTQFGLYTHLKELTKDFSSDGGPEGYSSEVKPRNLTAANTGMSGVSMVACCAHHLTDILPFFGLAGASLFLTVIFILFALSLFVILRPKTASLIINGNKVGSSSVWEGDAPGGHHREGTLTFSDLLPKTTSVGLSLNDISGIAARQFSWII